MSSKLQGILKNGCDHMSMGQEILDEYAYERDASIKHFEARQCALSASLKKSVWVTKDGEKLSIQKMSESHIKNCINMLDKITDKNEWAHAERDYIQAFKNELDRREKLNNVQPFQSAILLKAVSNGVNQGGYEMFVKLPEEMKKEIISYAKQHGGVMFHPDVEDIHQTEGAVIKVEISDQLIQKISVYATLYNEEGKDIGRVWKHSDEYHIDTTSPLAKLDKMARELLDHIEEPGFVTKDEIGYLTLGTPNDEEAKLFEAYKDVDSHMTRCLAEIRKYNYDYKNTLHTDIKYLFNFHKECFVKDNLKNPEEEKPITITEIVEALKHECEYNASCVTIYEEQILNILYKEAQEKEKGHHKGDGGRDDR